MSKKKELEKKEQKHQKPSAFINQMVEMMTVKRIETGDPKLDVIARQLQLLAAHADATDAFLDSQYE